VTKYNGTTFARDGVVCVTNLWIKEHSKEHSKDMVTLCRKVVEVTVCCGGAPGCR
jgi:hypothetical protein